MQARLTGALTGAELMHRQPMLEDKTRRVRIVGVPAPGAGHWAWHGRGGEPEAEGAFAGLPPHRWTAAARLGKPWRRVRAQPALPTALIRHTQGSASCPAAPTAAARSSMAGSAPKDPDRLPRRPCKIIRSENLRATRHGLSV